MNNWRDCQSGNNGLEVTEGMDQCGNWGENITAPSPANNEVHTVQLMIEQQSRVVEELRSSLARSNSKKVKLKLDSAIKHLTEVRLSVSMK